MTKNDFLACPLQQFDAWLEEAEASDEVDPTAFSLATASSVGVPSVRTLLFKGNVTHQGKRGLSFFSNSCSQKGENLAENPRAEMLFYWPVLYRQLRVSGQVVLLSREQTQAYFNSRPRGSQVSAHASQQSHPITSRQALLDRVEEIEVLYSEHTIPCPDYWQGYALLPERFEFWVGQKDRLHDRFVYRYVGNKWELSAIAP